MRISTALMYDRGLQQILRQQTDVSLTQQKMASGKRVLTPSDDPVGSVEIINLKQELSSFDLFSKNASLATSNLQLEEGTLNSVMQVLQRVRELMLQAGGILTESNRKAVSAELKQKKQELVSLGNTQNSRGEYLFSGYQSQTRPFSEGTNGSVQYNGDQGQRFVDVSNSISIPVSDSGYDIFVSVRNGNGTFTTEASATNTGTGVIDIGSITNPAAFNQETYTITFIGNNAQGQPAYRVDGAASGQILPALPGIIPDDAPAYVEGGAIAFAGVEMSISGHPHAGDTFTVSPSINQDIMTSVQKIIDVVEMPISGDRDTALFQSRINQAIAGIDQGIVNIDNARAKIGARLNTVDNINDFNSQMTINAKQLLSKIEDLDFAEAATMLSQQSFALEAAQQSFVRIQQLNLFSYLS